MVVLRKGVRMKLLSSCNQLPSNYGRSELRPLLHHFDRSANQGIRKYSRSFVVGVCFSGIISERNELTSDAFSHHVAV